LSSAGRIDELLLGSRSDGAAGGGGGSELVTGQTTDARMTLILDLSSKVTEQQTEIVRLRERLSATHAHGRTDDVSETSSAVDSEVPGCSWWESSARHDPGTDCVGGTDEDCGRLRSEGGEVRATAACGGAVKSDSTLPLSRLSPAASLDRPCSAARRRTATGRYQAHWASSCFDVQDEVTGDDEEDAVMTKTTSAAQT